MSDNSTPVRIPNNPFGLPPQFWEAIKDRPWSQTKGLFDDYKSYANAMATATKSLNRIIEAWSVHPECQTLRDLIVAVNRSPRLMIAIETAEADWRRVGELEEKLIVAGLIATDERAVLIRDNGDVLLLGAGSFPPIVLTA